MKTSNNQPPLFVVLFLGFALGVVSFFIIYRVIEIRKMSPLQRTLEIINRDYVDEIDVDQLAQHTVPLLLKSLDPHSEFFPREEAMAGTAVLEGGFDGIGVVFAFLRDTAVVREVVKDGPGERAGLKAGDRLISVNKVPLTGDSISSEYLLENLRGASGTIASVGIVRCGEKRTVQVVRGSVPMNSIDVAYKASSQVGVIRLNTWGRQTPSEFIAAAAQLQEQGAKAFVLDLRDNTGGYMDAAISLANQFLERNQLIVYVQGRVIPKEEARADGSGFLKKVPLAVLVNEFSASASEIFAGAMQDHDRAYIVGRRTFGKGLVQRPYFFPDSSSIHLTIARYYTPSGRFLQKKYTMGDRISYQDELVRRWEEEQQREDAPPVFPQETPQFKTDAGRTVYGGVGIVPDVWIRRDLITTNAYYNRLMESGTLPLFSFLFVDTHRKELQKLTTPQQLAAYLDRKPSLVNDYAFYAHENGVPIRMAMLNEVRPILSWQIRANIALFVRGPLWMYQFTAQRDSALQESISLLEEQIRNNSYMPFANSTPEK